MTSLIAQCDLRIDRYTHPMGVPTTGSCPPTSTKSLHEMQVQMRWKPANPDALHFVQSVGDARASCCAEFATAAIRGVEVGS